MDRNGGGGETGPQFEIPLTPETQEQSESEELEKPRPAHHEAAPSKAPQQAGPALQITTTAAAVPQVTDDTTQTDTTTQSAGPTAHLAAADANMIEREWVDKTKEVIGRTRSDPFAQKKAVSQLKADYISKRFNKKMKTDDAVDAIAA